MSQAKPIPDGYEHATPYLICRDAGQAIEFYKQAFAATELYRIPMPDGKVGHAEIKIAGAIITFADECPEMGATNAIASGQAVMSSPARSGVHPYVSSRRKGRLRYASICAPKAPTEDAMDKANTGMRSKSTGNSGVAWCHCLRR